MDGLISAEDIKVIKISIRSERFSDKEIHVAGMETDSPVALELNIYENILMPYLTGHLVLQDDNDLYRLGDLKGTERVEVHLQSPDINNIPIIKTFIISNIQKSVKTTDTATTLSINLIENHGYYSQLRPINKSYTGTVDEIIQKILSDGVNQELRPEYWIDTHQNDFRYIVPWLGPLHAASTITNMVSTTNGLPYFFFACINSDKLIFTDMESILARDAFNKDRPFIYSKGLVNRDKNNIEDKALSIMSYTADNLEETLLLATSGAIGSAYSDINFNDGKNATGKVDMLEEYNNIFNADIMSGFQTKPPIDRQFRETPDGKFDIPLNEYNSRTFHTVSASPYRDTKGLVADAISSRLLIIKNNYLKQLFRNVHRIYVPGALFTTKNLTTAVGHQIEMEILRSEIEDGASSTEDEKRSGTYTMLTKRHIIDITKNSHNCVISVGRLAERPRLQ